MKKKKNLETTWTLIEKEEEEEEKLAKKNVHRHFRHFGEKHFWWVRGENTQDPPHFFFTPSSNQTPIKTTFSSLFSLKFSILFKISPNKHTLSLTGLFFYFSTIFTSCIMGSLHDCLFWMFDSLFPLSFV